MFFDDKQQDNIYPQLMLSIAKVQRELLNCHFNWAERKMLPQGGGRIWERKKQHRAYEALLEKLEELKLQAKNHRRKMGYGNGIFWWNLPWPQLEGYLIYDLTQEDEAGNWRFQREWITQAGENGTLLLLREEGHCSSFSKSTFYETGIRSSYSESEINEKMRDYNSMMNRFDLATLALAGNQPMKSYLSGAEYDSGAEYLLSAEHLYLRDHYQTQYARSLYTETETTTITVSSHSTHYEALFSAAEFSLCGGVIQSLAIHNYALCDARGELPEDVTELYRSKDAAVGCAAFLADLDSAKTIPLKLFGKELKDGAPTFQDAMRQAEIYTCLAYKIEL